eukprot:PITA_02204
METTQRRAPDVKTESSLEESDEEDEAREETETAKVLKMLAKVGSKPKIEIPMYDGSLNAEEVMDWIRSIDQYFDYEEVEENKKVKFAVTRLKGHAAIWWDELQTSRTRKGKSKIKQWDKMVSNLKAKFLPKDYHLNLFKQMQNLKQKGMSVKEYTEEFYRLNIRIGHVEDDLEKVARYINGLRYEIQDEISLLSLNTVEDAYQAALKAEEKLLHKQNQRNRGKNPANEGRILESKVQHSQNEAGSASNKAPQRGDFGRGRFVPRGRGRGRDVRCFACGEWGHVQWDCPHQRSANQRNMNVAEAKEEIPQPEAKEEPPKDGESLLLRRVLLEGAKEPVQRRTLFRTIGTYQDVILCDIMPMDVCHILLGRPWKFDRNAIHDGRRNTCTLEKYGNKHTLLPLKVEADKEAAGNSVTLMNEKIILQEDEKGKEMHFASVGKPKVILNSTNLEDLPEEI